MFAVTNLLRILFGGKLSIWITDESLIVLKAFLEKERLPMRRTNYLRLSKIEGLYKTIIARGGRKIWEKGNVDKMYKKDSRMN